MDIDTDNSRKQLSTTTAAAIEAHHSAKDASQSQRVAQGQDLTSLNRLLQWSTANTASSPTDQPSPPSTTPTQAARDREWLDAAFPDMFAGVRNLATQLEDATTVDDRLSALENLQEFFLDLNYAENIEKLGVLTPVLQCARDDNPEIRAAAVWVLATAMQNLSNVKAAVLRGGGARVIADRLVDDHPPVRAKAVMAASALLRHADQSIHLAFDQVNGPVALRARLADPHVQTRRRARFFLQHAPVTGNEAFVDQLLTDRGAVAAFSATIAEVDGADVADVEAAVGALAVLADRDLQGLLQVAPELPGVLDALGARCDDEDCTDQVTSLASQMC